MCTDGNGGCVVVWHELHESLPTNTYDIKANRINNVGEREWGDTGILLENTVDSDPARIIMASDGNYYIQTGLTIHRIGQDGQILNQFSVTLSYPVLDPEGGVVLSGRVWTGMIPMLVAQRKDSLGNNLWQEPYVEIADSLYYLNARFNIHYNDGYYYYGWSGTKDGITRVAQFQTLRQDGSKLFPQGSVQISNNTPIGRPYIIPSDSGRTIFVWNDETISSTTFAQLYDTLGNKLWNESGVVVSYPAIAFQNTNNGQGGFITIGAINEFTIVAKQVSRNGNLGEVLPVPVELTGFYVNVNKDKIELFWQTATETNNSGFEILRFAQNDDEWETIGFVPGFGTTTEPKTYSFTDANILAGIYRYRLKQIDFDGTFTYSNEIEVEFDFTPKEFMLYQNYPNPFNPSTTIRYQIRQDGIVTLKIYDILGREVATLVNEEKPAGTYEVKFNVAQESFPAFASGVYIYKIQAGDFINSKKMILLK